MDALYKAFGIFSCHAYCFAEASWYILELILFGALLITFLWSCISSRKFSIHGQGKSADLNEGEFVNAGKGKFHFRFEYSEPIKKTESGNPYARSKTWKIKIFIDSNGPGKRSWPHGQSKYTSSFMIRSSPNQDPWEKDPGYFPAESSSTFCWQSDIWSQDVSIFAHRYFTVSLLGGNNFIILILPLLPSKSGSCTAHCNIFLNSVRWTLVPLFPSTAFDRYLKLSVRPPNSSILPLERGWFV